MKFLKDEKVWSVTIALSDTGKPATITVEATNETGRPGMPTIIYSGEKITMRKLKAGSDEYRIGTWAENHIFGTQLGPNRNVKPD